MSGQLPEWERLTKYTKDLTDAFSVMEEAVAEWRHLGLDIDPATLESASAAADKFKTACDCIPDLLPGKV